MTRTILFRRIVARRGCHARTRHDRRPGLGQDLRLQLQRLARSAADLSADHPHRVRRQRRGMGLYRNRLKRRRARADRSRRGRDRSPPLARGQVTAGDDRRLSARSIATSISRSGARTIGHLRALLSQTACIRRQAADGQPLRRTSRRLPTVYQPSRGSLMSRINHPSKTGVAVSLPLAAIAPATPAATPTSRRTRRDPRPRRSSHRRVASTGATRGSGPWAGSGSRCWPPAVASSPSACAVITSTPPRDRRA